MSALGHKQTCAVQKGMSALPPKAVIGEPNYARGTAMPSASMFKTSSNLFACSIRRIFVTRGCDLVK